MSAAIDGATTGGAVMQEDRGQNLTRYGVREQLRSHAIEHGNQIVTYVATLIFGGIVAAVAFLGTALGNENIAWNLLRDAVIILTALLISLVGLTLSIYVRHYFHGRQIEVVQTYVDTPTKDWRAALYDQKWLAITSNWLEYTACAIAIGSITYGIVALWQVVAVARY